MIGGKSDGAKWSFVAGYFLRSAPRGITRIIAIGSLGSILEFGPFTIRCGSLEINALLNELNIQCKEWSEHPPREPPDGGYSKSYWRRSRMQAGKYVGE